MNQKASDLREQGNFIEALKVYEEAIIHYQAQKDYLSLVHCLLGRGLTYKHLFLLKKDLSFAFLSQADAKSALQICSQQDLKNLSHLCFLGLAEAKMLFANFPKAIKYFTKALKAYPGDDSGKGRFIEHLGEAQYLNGDKESGLKNMIDGLALIRQYASGTDSFLVHVWESGCLLKLFSLTKDNQYLSQAEKIIMADDRLLIRKRQLEEVKKV